MLKERRIIEDVLPPDQEEMVSEFLRNERTSLDAQRFAELERFTRSFCAHAQGVDWKAYVKQSRLECRFRLTPHILPSLFGKPYGTTDWINDEVNEVSFPADAPFSYVLSALPKSEKPYEFLPWTELGALSCTPDFEQNRLLVEQLQGERLHNAKKMLRHLGLPHRQPNVTEVLFDIACGFARSQGMKIAIRKPEAARRVVQVRNNNGAETPYSRVAKLWDLKPSRIYFEES